MKNYLTNLFNSPVFRHVQRLAVVCLFLSIAASTFAGWTATYKANVTLLPNSTGKGKVYLNSNDPKTVSNTETSDQITASKGSSASSHTFNDVKITAEPDAGSKMAGWYYGDTDYDANNQVTNGEEKVYTIGKKTINKNSNTETDYFYVNFIARSYCIYKPNVKVYYKDAEGNLTESAAGGQVNLLVNNANEKGDLFVKQGDGTNPSATFDFQYDVTTNPDYHFVGWETSLDAAGDETYLSTSISYVPAPNSNCEYNAETSVVEGTLADRITYYAIFESTQKYYYQTVHAELAGETNGAQLVLNIQDGINANATVSGAPAVTYSPNPPRGMQDKKDFNVIYQVNITEADKVSFKGWSTQPGAGVNLSPDDNNNPTKYTATYTALSTDITTPFNAPAVYAILESYWYTNPMIKITDSSNQLGEIAYSMYEQVEPSNWAFEVDGTNVKNQVAVTGDEFKYDVYYYARPLNGAKFVGWATANDPSMLIPGSDEIPYKKSYTITSKDKNNPYKSDVLYAIFQSNVDVMYQDDIICYVDEKGNPNVNDAKVVVDMGSVNELHAELLTNQALFDLTDQYGMVHDNVIDVVSNEGLARLFVTYTGKDPVGDAEAYKTADIKLTTADGGETTITVQMKPVPIITFLPTYGKGSYEINHTDGRGVRYTMEEDSKDNIFISILQESMSIIELNLDFDAPANTIFKGWQINTKSGSTIFSENKRATYRFTESATVKPIYTTKGAGVFTILNDEEHVQYSDLQKALNVAKSRSAEKNQDQVVVFSNGSNDEAILPQGNYVIPNRVTLLIPGVGPSDGFDPSAKEANFEEDAYVYRVKHQDFIPNTDNLTDVVLGIDDYSNMSGEPVCYRKLVVADNTTITVEPGGSINMYAYLTFNQSYNYEARPLRYGQIELGENSQIILQESGNTGRSAQLYAFGYITGANSSRVIANAGSEVFELLQYSEVRGGTAIADLFFNRETNKVFPINQFYVQNIEIPLQINYGAVENVITTASMFSSSEYVVMSGLIVPNQSQYESGFMRMASGMKIIKTYDPYLDRLNITISSENNSLASLGFIDVRMGNLVPTLEPMIEQVIQGYNLGFLEGTAISLAKVVLKSYVGDVRLKSSEYVMPIPSNMDIVLENVNLTIPYDVAWLSGSTLKIDEKSILTIANGAKVFVYDFDEAILPETNWTADVERYAPGTGYYASNSAALIPISYTPNNSQHLLDANGAKIKSSDKTHIRNANGTYLFKRQMKSLDAYDGELVTGDAQWLVDGKIEVNGELYTTNGNARIISNSRGQVVFANEPVSGTVTKQAKLVGNQSAFMSNLIHTATSGLAGSEAEVHKIINFPVNSARLRNADGSFVITGKDTYTYSPIDGRWIGSQEEPLGEMEGEVVTVTLPEVNKNIDIQITGIEGLTSADGISATISWNGGASVSVSNISYNNGTLVFPLQYVPTNKAGEYDGVLTVSGYGNDISIRVVVTEDYTPKFDVTNPVQISQAVGYSIRTTAANFVLSPEVENVANTIRTAEDKYKATWTYTITGDDADEFTFHWGNGNNLFTDAYIEFSPNSAGEKNALLSFNVLYTDGNKQQHVTNVAIPLIGSAIALSPNPLAFAEGIDSIFVGASATELFEQVANGNTKPIVITPSTSEYYTLNGTNMSTTIKPNKVGTVTITADQEADLANGVAGTSISKTINITDNIVWNWENLYFGSENIYPISTLYNDWRLDIKDNDLNVIRDFTSVNPGDYKVVLESWPDGEAQPVFTLTYNDGTGEKTHDFTSHVSRDPRQLSVYINEERVYEAVTLNVSHVDDAPSSSGNDYYVRFDSKDEIAQWTFYFMGIPDKLSFNASGENNWQIEESANGTNWTIAYTWASIASSTEFELSLQPSTNYVRISYGTSSTPSSTPSKGVLSKIAVTELLSVKADVEKLYMPIIAPSSQKNVVFTYVSESDLALKTNSNVFTTNPTSLTGSNQSPFYQIKRVAVNSTATTEIKDGMLSVTGSSAAVPIRTYTYPQELPIQLASDELERYYFVTSESYNTSWSNDEATRSIVMRNAVADASPYVVFHFADTPAPGVISFNYANISDGASWTVQESEDGTVWYDLEVDTDNEMAGQVMRKFLRPEKSRYVRVIYNSDYAGTVDITNMAILPTTSVVVNPAQLTVFSDQPEELSVIASNLQDVQFTFTPSSAFSINQVKDKDGNVANNGIQYFQGSGSHNGKAVISYNATAAVTYGTLTITTNYDANGTRLDNPEVLATVELTGINRNLPNGDTGIKTGTGLKITNFKNANEGDEGYLREVNSKYAFDTNGKPLFDYVIIYGETKTTDGSGTVTAPSSVTGSNAQTPCYIYKKSGDQYVIEDETYLVENANSSRKSWRGAISIADNDASTVDAKPENLRVYITGFCPYASTGYTQSDEGVWYFEGDAGDKIDIYLEDCYIYSRYKSKRGNSFTRESGESYSGMVARGSGAVLLFANKTQKDGLTTPLEVTIHTRDRNLLKSHYGCLFSSFVGRAFQISSPVHIYMQSENHYKNSYTTLTFDDKWPTDADDDTKYNRTNGFLSLQKQVNNAPSIDMGNKNTVVNFRGGHVELQNACISSDNYESSLAISYRTGVYGPSKFRFVLSYGIGTDGVEGTVNFYDGTTTVLPMEVPERFRQYYLMDDNGTTTSCLRTPKNTYVYGGSHCMMRACEAPTSKGGAPTDGISALGKFEYTYDMVWNANTAETENHVDCRLVTPTSFPDSCLTEYYKNKYTYGLKSVTPVDGKLNLWIPDLDCPQFEVKPEVDQQISFWKASMTLIEANYGVYSGSVGGDNVEIAMQDGEQKEQVQNLLYCQIDDNISGVISAQGNDQYVAPVLNPAPDGGYISIAPTTVGTELQNYVRNTGSYVIEDKVYYVTTIPQADVWMNFTAPFNVANIYVVEAYDEDLLDQAGVTRDEILVEQARHNANFAAFFGVAIALESKKTFNMIYNDYMGWVRHEYGSTAASKQGMKLLQHYYETYDAEGKYEGSNWRTADYYLYKNTANWMLNAEGNLTTQWGYVPMDVTLERTAPLLKQGETYSMLFPYCTGCWEYDSKKGYYRNEWDYWSGKFIIFESTQGPHTIQGSDYVAETDIDDANNGNWIFENIAYKGEAKLMGNSTFAQMIATDQNIYSYSRRPMNETYDPIDPWGAELEPTATFLYGDLSRDDIRPRITRNGEVIYDTNGDGTVTGGNMPTVGGGNDLFITSTAEGINIAVAEAQHVRVMSATGAIIYSGMVQTAVDVALPATGVYVIAGENEVHKILH